MSPEIPIGRREGQRLAFVPRADLEAPEAILRQVAGMFNAEGGEVWIGVRSKAGVAVELEGVDDAEGHRRRLREALIDRIEPTPGPGEVQVEVVSSERDLLRVLVRPREFSRPYALIRGGGWEFPLRVGVRARRLSREEIGDLFRVSATSPPNAKAETPPALRSFLDDQRRVLESGETVVWIGSGAELGGRDLDLAAVLESDLLTEPRRTGSPDLFGWPAELRGALLAGGLQVETRWVAGSGLLLFRTRGGDEIRLDPSGGLAASAPLARFAARHGLVDLPALVLSPDQLVGRIVSALRVLARIYSTDDLWRGEPPLGTEPAWVSMAVAGLGGWKLLPGRLPREEVLPRRAATARTADTDFILDSPLSLTVADIRDEPDRCAFRLLTRFYEWFGFSESDVPYFDSRTERFDWSLGRAL